MGSPRSNSSLQRSLQQSRASPLSTFGSAVRGNLFGSQLQSHPILEGEGESLLATLCTVVRIAGKTKEGDSKFQNIRGEEEAPPGQVEDCASVGKTGAPATAKPVSPSAAPQPNMFAVLDDIDVEERDPVKQINPHPSANSN
ncbi:hypothetical protein R1sor_027566 [Riccia sorocarpa]|uniref:Uncharacterized protein n=1 Tax=Riccia sorocarpa TaxID=122646 RepID=A0ABD3GFB8_9MARC